MPQELTQWAIALRDRISQFPYGQQWSTVWGWTSVVAEKFPYVDSSSQPRRDDGVGDWDLPRRHHALSPLAARERSLRRRPRARRPGPESGALSISAVQPPERTDGVWSAACAAALATVAGGFVLGLRKAGR